MTSLLLFIFWKAKTNFIKKDHGFEHKVCQTHLHICQKTFSKSSSSPPNTTKPSLQKIRTAKFVALSGSTTLSGCKNLHRKHILSSDTLTSQNETASLLLLDNINSYNYIIHFFFTILFVLSLLAFLTSHLICSPKFIVLAIFVTWFPKYLFKFVEDVYI